MEFKQVVAQRHSVRDFTEQPVSRQDLVDIVRTAQRAPSWVNSQPWRVYAATGAALATIKERFAEKGDSDFPVMPRTQWSPAARANMADLSSRIEALGETAQDFAASQGRLFNAQAVLYVTIPKGSSLWSIHDLGAFSMLLALASVDKGLGAINAYALVHRPDIVREVMGIGEDETLAVGIALGHPADSELAAFAPDRVDVDQILTIPTVPTVKN